MAITQGDPSLLEHPVAKELLASSIPARLAYVSKDGTPRVAPIWFHWNGQEIVMGTPPSAAKAKALAQNPKVLLLDEPFAGLSIDERRDVQQLLLAIPRDVTIVMIEHNMDVALEFAERITLLHFGEVIVEGNRAEVVADPRTREVYLGH